MRPDAITDGQVLKFLGAAKGNVVEAAVMCRAIYGPHADATAFLEKAASGTSTADLGGDPAFRSSNGGLLEEVAIRSVVGMVDAAAPRGFRRDAPSTRLLRQSSRPTASWVREGEVIRGSKFTFEPFTYEARKIGTLVMFTSQFFRSQGAPFETALIRDLVVPIAFTESDSFLDPGNSGVGGEEPASITYGVEPLTSTGNPRSDIQLMAQTFTGDLDNAVLIMSPELAVAAGGHFNDTCGARGGEIATIPVVTHAAARGESNGPLITLVDPAGIALVDEGVEIDFSESGSIQLEDDPSQGFLSLFQLDLVAARAIRRINWTVLRPGAVLTLAPSWGEPS